MDKKKEIVPLLARDPDYYRLRFTNGLPPGTDSVEQLQEKPRLPRPPPKPKRPLPPLPPRTARTGKWLEKYLNTVSLLASKVKLNRTLMSTTAGSED